MKRLFPAFLLLLLFSASAEATTKLMFGAELNHLSELGTNNGGTIDSSTKHAGCCSLSQAAGTNYTFLAPTGLNASTLYTRYYTRVHITTNPSSTTVLNGLIIYNGAADVAYVRIVVTSGGALSFRLYNAIAGAQVGSDSSFTADTWYLVEIKTVISATVGVLELKVNGSVVATGSSLNTGSTSVSDIVPSAYQATLNGLVATVWYDDVLASNSAYPGAGQLICRQAGLSGTPTYDAWTKIGGVLPAIWDDIPFNSGGTASSPVTGDPLAQTYFIASFGSTQTGHGTEVIAAADIINAVQGVVAANNGSDRTYKIRRRVSAANTDTVISGAGSQFFKETPWTDTLTNINAMELGGEKSGGAGGSVMQIDDIYVFVDFTTGVPGSPIHYYRMMSQQ